MNEIKNVINDIIYSDLSLYDSNISMNENAVLQSIINLMQTEQYERFFSPDAYIEWDYIMANLNQDVILRYYEKILEEEIPLKEPRVKEVKCKLEPLDEPHTLLVEMQIYLKTGGELKEFFKIAIGA